MSAIILAGLAGMAWFFRKGGIYNPVENPTFPAEPHNPPPAPPVIDPLEGPKQPSKPVSPPEPLPVPTPAPKLDFSTPKAAYHSTRVIADEIGLALNQKNDLCACIYQESRFDNRAIGKNQNSTDWGIVQVNDTKGWHIGPGLRFPSVQYVKDNPEECVRWMAGVLKQTGKLQPWASWTSGAYIQWLVENSPMWKLAR